MNNVEIAISQDILLEINAQVDVGHCTLRKATEDLISENNELGDDLMLLRWLKYCDLNVKKAERRMRDAVKWRKENNIEELVDQESHPELVLGIPFIWGGKCRDRTPVVTVEGGKVDFKGLVDKHGKDVVYRYCVQNLAQFERRNIKWNRERRLESDNKMEPITENSIQGFVFVIDAKNVSYRQLSSIKTIQVISQTCMDYMNYFQALGSRLIIFNCNWLAVPLINIMKPILQGPNLTIEVYDNNVDKWKPAMLQRIHPDEIGVAFGGNRP